MCMFPELPKPPQEPQQAKAPDAGAVTTAVGRRVTDRMKSATNTILTSGSGVSVAAPVERKTLLGQ